MARFRRSFDGGSRQQNDPDETVLEAIRSLVSDGNIGSTDTFFDALPKAKQSSAATLLQAADLFSPTNPELGAQLAFHGAVRCAVGQKGRATLELLQNATVSAAARFLDLNRPYEALESLSLAVKNDCHNDRPQYVRFATMALERIFANSGTLFWWHDVLQSCQKRLLIRQMSESRAGNWPDTDGAIAHDVCRELGLVSGSLAGVSARSQNRAVVTGFDLIKKRVSGESWRHLGPQWQLLADDASTPAPLLALLAYGALSFGKGTIALKYAERAHANRPTDPLLALLLSNMLDVNGDEAAAVTLCQPIDPVFWRQCAHLVARFGGPTAKKHADDALPKQHTTDQGLLERVWALEELGRLFDSAQLLKEHLQSEAARQKDQNPELNREVAEQAARVFTQVVLQSPSPFQEASWLDLSASVTRDNASVLSGERLANFLEACVVARDLDTLQASLAHWIEVKVDVAHIFASPAFVDFIARIAEEISFESNYFLDERPTSSALLEVASSLVARGNPAHSGSLYVLAALADPSRHGLCFAAGWALAQSGFGRAAEIMFEKCGRILGRPCRDIVWPKIGRDRWPYMPFFDLAFFENALPKGKTWPLISIVIPSYNQGEFIEETLLSILNQGYPNTQIIIMDGASSDNTMAVLETYRDRIDVLVSEPDRGQTHAINKGFAHAKGDVLAYLCSDDLYAPGALHRAALAWLETQADLMVGIIIAFRDYGFEAANRPAVREGGFTIERLADIFGYWMKGHFFYEPEVFFSKNIWEKSGAYFDEKLFYTMDYEYWVRCAKFGATLASISWPFALFRQHEGQKTHRLVKTLCEQSNVRDTYLKWEPDAQRRDEILKRLDFSLQLGQGRYFVAPSIYTEGIATDCPDWTHVTSFDDLPDAANLVVAIACPGLELKSVEAWRQSNSTACLIGWAVANFHHHQANHDVAEAVDILVPAHGHVASYLASQRSLLASPVFEPLQSVAKDANHSQVRSDLIWGHLLPEWLDKSNLTLIDLIKSKYNHALNVAEPQVLNNQRRNQQIQHKVALVLSVDDEVSIEIFEALLLGQTIVVPSGLDWGSYGLTETDLASHGIYPFAGRSLEAFQTAFQLALEAFNQAGPLGCIARSEFAQEHRNLGLQLGRLIEVVKSGNI